MAYPAGELIQYISEQASNEGQAWGQAFLCVGMAFLP